jgi:hypothetical protein
MNNKRKMKKKKKEKKMAVGILTDCTQPVNCFGEYCQYNNMNLSIRTHRIFFIDLDHSFLSEIFYSFQMVCLACINGTLS